MQCDLCSRGNLSERELLIHKKYFHKGKVSSGSQPAQIIATGACPDCGDTLWYQEGCSSCRSCGYSKCG